LVANISSKISVSESDSDHGLSKFNKNREDINELNNKINDMLSDIDEGKSYALKQIADLNKSIFDELINLNDKMVKLSTSGSSYTVDMSTMKYTLEHIDKKVLEQEIKTNKISSFCEEIGIYILLKNRQSKT
jgi:uncharacterized protein YoxC